MSGRPRRVPRAFIACLALGLFCAFQSCSDSEFDRVKRLAPDVPDDILHHLVASDDSTLERFVRETGLSRMKDARDRMYRSIRSDSPESFASSRATLLPYLLRLRRIVPTTTGNAVAYIDTVSPEVGVRFVRLRDAYENDYRSATLTPAEKVERLLQYQREFEELGIAKYVASTNMSLADLFGRMGNDDALLSHLHKAIYFFRNTGQTQSLCQGLGVLGSHFAGGGETDSMVACYEEALDAALGAGEAYQAARIYSFYAVHYRNQGRLALAHDMYQAALDVCRRFGEGMYELRFVLAAARFYAGIGAWDAVAQLLERADALKQQFPEAWEAGHGRWWDELNVMRARYLMARGEVDRAAVLFEETAVRYGESMHDDQHIELLLEWAQGLVDNGRYEEALPVIREGYRRAVELKTMLRPRPRFSLMLARAHAGLGSYDQARRAVEQFDHEARDQRKRLRRGHVARDVLLARIHLAEGDAEGARAAIETGILRLEDMAGTLEPGIQTYLWIGQCEELRQVAHEVVREDARRGYGLELLWRRIQQQAGARRETVGNPFDQMEALARSAAAGVTQRGALHCTYVVRGQEVWRWTHDGARVRRDVLGSSTADIERLVSETWEMLANPDAPEIPSVELVDNLRTLAGMLLPPELLQAGAGSGDALFLITVDGFLARIPFEALNTAQQGYAPLLQGRDVAYLRHAGGTSDRDVPLPGVIVVPSPPAASIRRQYANGGALAGALVEGKAVHEAFPDATYLRNADATKQALRERWEDAGFVYIASHILRDPEIPFLAFLPLSPPAQPSAPDESALHFHDIRRANLSTCNTVVLSGCASGAPYLDMNNTAPSIGDAFLDSGATFAIQTFWNVKDKQASDFMLMFVQEWRSNSTSPVTALCNARRASMHSVNGIRHPFYWASYFVTVGRL